MNIIDKYLNLWFNRKVALPMWLVIKRVTGCEALDRKLHERRQAQRTAQLRELAALCDRAGGLADRARELRGIA